MRTATPTPPPTAAEPPWCALIEHPDGYVMRFGGSDAAALKERLLSFRGSVPPPRRRWDPTTKSWWIDPVVEQMVRSLTRWTSRSFAPDRVQHGTHAAPCAHRWAACDSGETVDEGWHLTVPTAPAPAPRSGPVVPPARPPRAHAPAPTAPPPAGPPAAPLPPPPTSHAPAPDPHAVLWLRPGAPWPVIKAVYRGLAHMYHPDRGGDAAKMQDINAAYAILRRQAEPVEPAAPRAAADPDDEAASE